MPILWLLFSSYVWTSHCLRKIILFKDIKKFHSELKYFSHNNFSYITWTEAFTPLPSATNYLCALWQCIKELRPSLIPHAQLHSSLNKIAVHTPKAVHFKSWELFPLLSVVFAADPWTSFRVFSDLYQHRGRIWLTKVTGERNWDMFLLFLIFYPHHTFQRA